MTAVSTDILNDVLITGEKFMAARPGFKCVGRDKDLKELQEILLQKGNNCVIMTGASGVGMTALGMGLQASKEDATTPPKLMGMPIFFLDVDKLFESGDSAQVNKMFREIRARLAATKGSLLYIENMGNFVDCCNKGGFSHLMNGLLGDIKNGKYQAILETPYEDLGKVIKYNADMKARYTLRDIKEPKGDDLRAIVDVSIGSIEKHHGIKISKEAVDMAIALATKHKTAALQALPSGIVTLLDRALSSYALKAHSNPLQLVTLESRLKLVQEALETGKPHDSLAGQSTEELEARKAAIETDITEFRGVWDERQKSLVKTHTGIRRAQERIDSLTQQVADQRAREAQGGAEQNAAVGESPEITALNEKIEQTRVFLTDGVQKFEAMTTEVNKELVLGETQVLDTFSDITGIPVKKLSQSDREKIMGLKERLNGRVFDQEHAVEKVCNAVRNSAAGLTPAGKPRGTFLFLGPSGVGKTELVKALGEDLFDDPNAILRLDMSEYMEKNSTNKLIGPPPGFVGFEEGGMMTEAMQKRPIRILLVDEIEKAHPDVLNVFLQVLDDARVTDGKGVTSSFEDVYIIFTSNIGQNNYPDKGVDYEAATAQSVKELIEAGVRNELLNRFGGKRNIIGFFPLEAPTMVKIVNRELNGVNKLLDPKGLRIELSADDIKAIGHTLYSPANGARAVPGFFADEVRPKAADIILETPEAKGVLEMAYNPDKKTVALKAFRPEGARPDAEVKAASVVSLQGEMQRAAAQPRPVAA